MRRFSAIDRSLGLLVAVAAFTVLAGCGFAGANEGASVVDRAVTPTAMDLLAPIDREAFHSSRSDLNSAVWDLLEVEWQSCVQRDGFSFEGDLGYELSPLSNVAAYDFIAPSVVRDQGGAIRFLDDAVAELSPEEAKSVERCHTHLQSVLNGDAPAEADVDKRRLEVARTALTVLESEASTFPLLYSELDRQVANGQWKGSVECIRSRGVEVPDHASDSPNATLEAVGAKFDGTQSSAEVGPMIAEAGPRLDTYIDCSAAFYDGLSAELKKYRTDALESHRPAFVELSAAVSQLSD